MATRATRSKGSKKTKTDAKDPKNMSSAEVYDALVDKLHQAAVAAGKLTQMCESCGRLDNAVQACESCLIVHYCGPECRAKDLAFHEDACKVLKKQVGTNSKGKRVLKWLSKLNKKHSVEDFAANPDWWDAFDLMIFCNATYFDVVATHFLPEPKNDADLNKFFKVNMYLVKHFAWKCGIAKLRTIARIAKHHIAVVGRANPFSVGPCDEKYGPSDNVKAIALKTMQPDSKGSMSLFMNTWKRRITSGPERKKNAIMFARCFSGVPPTAQSEANQDLLRVLIALTDQLTGWKWGKPSGRCDTCRISLPFIGEKSVQCNCEEPVPSAPEVKKLPPVCQHCGAASEDTLRCAGCTIVFYCSRECQVANWAVHKEGCMVLRQHIKTNSKGKQKLQGLSSLENVADPDAFMHEYGKFVTGAFEISPTDPTYATIVSWITEFAARKFGNEGLRITLKLSKAFLESTALPDIA